MIKDALEYLMSLAAKRVEPIDLGIKDPTCKLVLVEGKVLTIQTPVRPRDHQPTSLVDLMGIVEKNSDEPVIFFNESAVVGILDDQDHRVELATFNLAISDQFATVKSLAQRGWMDQKSFVRLLKIDLRGCLEPVELLDVVRKLKFENNSEIRSEVGRRKESLGSSISAQVTAEREIPDEVELELPIYKSLGEKDHYRVTCSVEVDPTKLDAFRLLPLPDELERVQHLAIASIRDRLTKGLPNVPCFYGRP